MDPVADASVHEAPAPLRDCLAPGETLIWWGRPKQGLMLQEEDLWLTPVALVWLAFTLYWTRGVLASPLAPRGFAVFGVLFVLSALYVLVLRFFVDAALRSRTFYGLSDRRVLVRSDLFRPSTQSFPLRGLRELSLHEQRDGSGSILLKRPVTHVLWVPGMRSGPLRWSSAPAIERIVGAREVYERILEASRKESP